MSQDKQIGNRVIQTITPAELSQSGVINAINKITGPVRADLKQVLDAHGKDCNVHIAVIVEPLTDSAGSPLMTRGAGK